MKFTVNGMKHRIIFRHLSDRLNEQELSKLAAEYIKRKNPLIVGGTEAIIECLNPIDGKWHKFTAGYSFCFAGDEFVKDVGRRIALKRAILNRAAIFSKEQRKLIWDTYFERNNTGCIVVTVADLEATLSELSEEAGRIIEMVGELRGRATATK